MLAFVLKSLKFRSVNLPPGGLEDDQPVPKSLLRLIQAGQRTSGFRGKPISKIKLLQQGQVKGALFHLSPYNMYA